ncbi:hypothetical protein E2C01_039528 [Portunus trituberculatus]|uniref:Uncharacterized protein n=1 Tax=Portunus trituberculatus TaxID=210409 RepID=A0A5B7FH26_PORTR|nr:hypothetical protein [Portunus trituberculatus]
MTVAITDDDDQMDSTISPSLISLTTTIKVRVFANPSHISQALHTSNLGKYLLEGETRSLGNGSALIVTVWEHNIPKVHQMAHLHLGVWEVAPFNRDTNQNEVLGGLRPLNNGEVFEAAWIAPHCLPRYAMGKWLHLKIRGSIPTIVAILQLVYWAQPYLLPLLRCPDCQKIGHSINTCRLATLCSRCSGSHPYCQQDATCTRQHHCSFNQNAWWLYISLTQKGNSFHTINKKLRELQWTKPQLPRRPTPPPPPPPRTRAHMASPSVTTLVCPDISYSTITGENCFSALTDLHEEEEVDPPQEITDTPASP